LQLCSHIYIYIYVSGWVESYLDTCMCRYVDSRTWEDTGADVIELLA